MKRVISLCCVCLILVMSLSVPARAVEYDSFIEVLEYSFPDNGTSPFVTVYSGSQDVRFSIPRSGVYYVDILVNMTGNIPNSVSFYAGGDLSLGSGLTVESMGNNLYRFYGNVFPAIGSDLFTLRFDTSSPTYIYFHSVRILTSPFGNYTVPVEGTGFYPDGNFNLSKNWGDQRPTTATIIHDGVSFNDRDFVLYLEPDDWQKFDILEFQLSLIVSDITSVSCVMGNINIPVDVSYTQFSNSDSMYYLTLSIDVSNLDRSSSDFPMIIVQGHVIFDGVSSVAITNSHGFFKLNQVSEISNLFARLHSWLLEQTESIGSFFSSNFLNLKSWIEAQSYSLEFALFSHFSSLNGWISTLGDRLETAIRGDSSPGDDFQDQVDQKDQELEDMAAVMDSVTKPAIQDINVSLDQYVKPADVQVLATPLTVFLEADLFRTMIIMSILLATVSFTLYGKR